ncbi:hypothetical protein NL676_014506 [Syzygium grande]|nr:hypothetical protein NL676_014506 [Syzygium grande]
MVFRRKDTHHKGKPDHKAHESAAEGHTGSTVKVLGEALKTSQSKPCHFHRVGEACPMHKLYEVVGRSASHSQANCKAMDFTTVVVFTKF